LGYQARRLSGVALKKGLAQAIARLSTEAHMSRVVELTEHCVLTMSKPLQRVVKHRYIGQEFDEMAARKMHLTLDVYQTRINQAVHFLADYLIENNY